MRIIINSLFISIGIPVLSNDILTVDVSKQQCLEYQCFTVCETRTADNSTTMFSTQITFF